jgi:hypothetical protein
MIFLRLTGQGTATFLPRAGSWRLLHKYEGRVEQGAVSRTPCLEKSIGSAANVRAGGFAVRYYQVFVQQNDRTSILPVSSPDVSKFRGLHDTLPYLTYCTPFLLLKMGTSIPSMYMLCCLFEVPGFKLPPTKRQWTRILSSLATHEASFWPTRSLVRFSNRHSLWWSMPSLEASWHRILLPP